MPYVKIAKICSLLIWEVKKVAGATDDRPRTGWEKKIPHHCAECNRVIKSGSDGVRYRTCHVWSAFNIDYRLVVQYWLEHTPAAKLGTDKPHRSITPDSTPKLLLAQIEKAA